jgi:hypothetical protein
MVWTQWRGLWHPSRPYLTHYSLYWRRYLYHIKTYVFVWKIFGYDVCFMQKWIYVAVQYKIRISLVLSTTRFISPCSDMSAVSLPWNKGASIGQSAWWINYGMSDRRMRVRFFAGQRFSTLLPRPNWQPPILWEPWRLSLGVKRRGREPYLPLSYTTSQWQLYLYNRIQNSPRTVWKSLQYDICTVCWFCKKKNYDYVVY